MSNETLLTIAQRTGYSISTVSRVLSGNAKKYRIGDKTVEIIKEEARKCHYTPSLLAKGLRNKETNTIGLLIPSLENYFFSNLASTVITEATVFGYTVIIVCTQEKEQNEAECLRQLMSRRVDGIVAVPSGHSPKEFEMIAEQVPIILIDRYFASFPDPCAREGARIQRCLEKRWAFGIFQCGWRGLHDPEWLHRDEARAQLQRQADRYPGAQQYDSAWCDKGHKRIADENIR